MLRSPFDRLRNILRTGPPPAWMRREDYVTPSVFSRIWRAIGPPERVHTPKPRMPLEQVRRQRRLKIAALGAIVALGAGWGLSAYVSGAPQRSAKQFQVGMKFMRPGQYPEAIDQFTRAIAIWPKMADAYIERGNAHHYLSEVDLALADFDRALALNPNLARAHTGLGTVYLERGDTRRALEHFNQSLAIEPNLEAYYERGMIHESLGEHKQAIEDFDKALAENPAAPYMYRARAQARQNLGDLEGAHEDRQRALKIEGRRR